MILISCECKYRNRFLIDRFLSCVFCLPRRSHDELTHCFIASFHFYYIRTYFLRSLLLLLLFSLTFSCRSSGMHTRVCVSSLALSRRIVFDVLYNLNDKYFSIVYRHTYMYTSSCTFVMVCVCMRME